MSFHTAHRIEYQNGSVWMTREKPGVYFVWRQTTGSTCGAHCGSFSDWQNPERAAQMAREHVDRMAARMAGESA